MNWHLKRFPAGGRDMAVLSARVYLRDLTVRPQPWAGLFPSVQRPLLLPDLERAR